MSAESPAIGPTSMFGLTQKTCSPPRYQNVRHRNARHAGVTGSAGPVALISDIVSLEDVRSASKKLERQDGNRSGFW